jgi:hypothetical protein
MTRVKTIAISTMTTMLAACAAGWDEEGELDPPAAEEGTASCGSAHAADPEDSTVEILAPDTSVIESSTYDIVYVGRASGITNFRSPITYGQHLQYFPNFDRGSVASGERTDKNMVLFRNGFSNLRHHECYPPHSKRTFSCDALGSPPGVKTRGGPYSGWATFTLPDGRTGRSGSFYDPYNRNNSNNSVNGIFFNTNSLQGGVCVNLITDNTGTGDRQHNPNVTLRARSNRVENGTNVPSAELTFDGQADMHTFLYVGHKDGDKIRLRMACNSAGCPESNKGSGLGGIMVSALETCAAVQGGQAPEAWAGQAGTPHEHPEERGLNRLLVFTAHGAGCDGGEVTEVWYGGMPLTRAVARDQRSGDQATHTSIWILAEADLREASDAEFTVSWSREPAERRYASSFLFNVNQDAPLAAVGTAGCNDCDDLACAPLPAGDRRLVLSATTHADPTAALAPADGFAAVAPLSAGVSLAARPGTGQDESPRTLASAPGTQSQACAVINGWR